MGEEIQGGVLGYHKGSDHRWWATAEEIQGGRTVLTVRPRARAAPSGQESLALTGRSLAAAAVLAVPGSHVEGALAFLLRTRTQAIPIIFYHY
eukprot:188426-Pyramimonas_sp.AAC.1